ncbi:Dabb family protein [Telmatocola sphagniphila]|uniref:Dabb family protein n=1 Tax=Telmatocola sphagniphila TaxID=1123043 RepID=A0A8E6ETK8_9BACT|nr:Dabb family protein [Telmatocola sphagniphila]QVL32554.1 Dabb family protein [Telmatocola sphagniphila]
MFTRRLLLALVMAFGLQFSSASAEDPQIVHMVYFSLKEPTKANKEAMVAGCKKYLKDIDGIVYFSSGIRGEAFARDINDKEFDVSLNIVFKNKAAHDKYSDHPKHLEFIKEFKDQMAKVRVFDSEVK